MCELSGVMVKMESTMPKGMGAMLRLQEMVLCWRFSVSDIYVKR